MLCRLALAADPTLGRRGIDEAREAGVILEKAKERLDPSDKTLKAHVELAEGIWNMVMAIKGTLIIPSLFWHFLIPKAEQDHLSRASRLTNALSLLESSIDSQPSASAHFHIAIASYRPIPARNLEHAIENARAAVELEPDNIRYWHLLGLLLAASEDWRGAREVLEAGATMDDQAWMAEQSLSLAADDTTDSSTIRRETEYSTSITKIDFASPAHPGQQSPSSEAASTVTERVLERETILDPHSHTLPPAAELLQPLPDHPPPSATERFEHALQLRMTQLALTELTEGPEGTEEKWIDVFQWFAKRKGPDRDQSRKIPPS